MGAWATALGRRSQIPRQCAARARRSSPIPVLWGVKTTGIWVRDGAHDTHNPPRGLVGFCRAWNGARHGDGGSARWDIAGVHAFTRSRPRFWVQRVWVCAPRYCKPKQGQHGIVQNCREPSTADLRRAWRRNAGERCSGLGVGLGAATASAKGPGQRDGAYRGLGSARTACRVDGDTDRR